jgi:ABC-type antimicrobial peptide transport system permease subunit
MLKNYFKIAFRNLLRYKVFSLINIFGLSVGMACTILILLWVHDELSFDTFFKNSDRIYLVLRGENTGLAAVSSRLLGPALKEELPEVEKTGCYMPLPESFTCEIRNGDKVFEEQLAMADSSFFDLFSFSVKEGDPATMLRDPKSIVITEETARKYFGNETAAGKLVGVTVLGQQFTMKVSAVLNTIPANSDIQSQILFPMSLFETLGIKDYGWQNQSSQTYIQLTHAIRDTNDIRDLSLRIKACELRHDPYEPSSLNYSLLPLTEIHLHGSNVRFLLLPSAGDIKYVQIFMAVALIILLIAVLNYVNLSTALSLKRTAEVGIRKAIGASRSSLMFQFLGESLFLALFALAFALILAEILIPEFNLLSGKKLSIRYSEPAFLGMVFLMTLFTGVVSGGYPALVLSSFTPVQMLKGKVRIKLGRFAIRKGLVVFQFALSIIMIACTIVVFNQLLFIRKSNLGFDKDNILCVRAGGEANSKYDVFKNEMQKDPDIISISHSEPLGNGELGRTLGVNWPEKTANEEIHFRLLHSDCDLASTYKLEMSQGRYFSAQYPSDATDAYVINEAAAKAMRLKSPLSEKIQVWGRNGTVIGVTKDFHFASFHSVIEPLIFRIPDKSDEGGRLTVISIRFKAGMPENTLAHLKEVWREQMKDIPLYYYFYDDALNAQYGSEHRMETIFKYFSFLSIVIASLGLFGLASLSAEQRSKEIGIRKILGATVTDISVILSKEFVLWVVVSNLIAWPISFYAMSKWLESFAYRVDLSWWVFVLAGLIAVVVALVTVGWHAIRAATANPVESLRYE